MPTDPSKSSNISTGSAPKWVDAALIQKALRDGGGEDANVSVENIVINRAIAPGENFSSLISRVHIKLADGAGERTVLVKNLPEGESLAKSTVETGGFRIEISMLVKLIPTIQALLDQASTPGRFPPLAARCLLHGASPEPFIVLEDLKPQGFRMAERQRGLGLRHSLLALRALARFHAASVKLLKTDPNAFKEFPNPFRSSGVSWEPYLMSCFQLSADVCKKWPGYEDYADILERLTPKAMELLTKLNDPSTKKFNVLLHGDFWTNNMMFQYDENGRLNDFRMVDLQLCHLASPTIDLLYFLYTSLSDEVSKRHETLLIREYHTALTEALEMFGIDGPSFKELMADIDEHGLYGVFGSMGVWAIARAEAVPDIDASFAGDSSGNSFMYESAQMKRWLQRMLPEFKRRGWLEY